MMIGSGTMNRVIDATDFNRINLVGAISGLIPFAMRFSRVINFLPILCSSLVCFSTLTCYIIAVLMNHVYPFLPTISTTAAFEPGGSIFGILLFFVAFFVLVLNFLRYLQLDRSLTQLKMDESDIWRKIRTLNKVAVALGVFSIIGIVAVANVRSGNPLYVMTKVHDAGTAILFVGGGLFSWCQTFISYHVINTGLNSRCMFVVRLTLSFMITVTGVLYPVFKYEGKFMFQGNSAHWIAGFALHVASTAGEWILCFCLAAYIASFHREFQNFSVDVSYVWNDNNNGRYTQLPCED